MLFSVAALIATAGLGISFADQSRHLWDISIAQAKHVAHLDNVIEVLYGPIMFPAKLCVLLQMQRLFLGSKRGSVYWCTQGLIWSNFLFYIATTAAFIGACSPRAKIWDPSLPGTCISRNALMLASSAINIISDITILCLPVFAVWKLKLPIKRKMIISAVFSSGLL